MATKLDVGTLSLKGGVEEVVAMGSGVGREVSSVFKHGRSSLFGKGKITLLYKYIHQGPVLTKLPR